MEEWIFLGERSDDGVVYQLAKHVRHPEVYRFEPLMTPLQGFAVGEFRKKTAERRRVLSVCKNNGLLRIEGPIHYQNRLWVGWESLPGTKAFPCSNITSDLTAIIGELLPLIRAYEITHLAGMVIGAPDWGRIIRNGAGLHMPDPWIKEYLARPTVQWPTGLHLIFPPEILKGEPPSLNSDRFYLGLLLYCMLSGRIPYSLKKGWPQGISTGKTVPLICYQPRVNPALSDSIDDLLAFQPQDRPSVREIRTLWQEALRNERHLASSREYIHHLHKSRRYFTELRVFDLFQRLKTPLTVIGVGLAIAVGSWQIPRRPPLSAEHFMREVLQSPASVAPSINRSGCADLIAKIAAEQDRRLALMQELNNRPYVEIESVKVLAETPKASTLHLTLKWWTWEQGRWQPHTNQEKIILKKRHNSWKMVATSDLGLVDPPTP